MELIVKLVLRIAQPLIKHRLDGYIAKGNLRGTERCTYILKVIRLILEEL